MSQDGVMPALIQPPFSTQPQTGSYTIVGLPDDTITELYNQYRSLMEEAGRLYSTFANTMEPENENYHAYQKLVNQCIPECYAAIMDAARQLTGYARVFFLSTGHIAVMNSDLSEQITNNQSSAH